MNAEGDLLAEMMPDAVQVSGADSDQAKEAAFIGFSDGSFKTLIIKPKIGAWGLNWQHCNRTTFFPSHSFEQYYQGVRRFWRFGQTRPVTVDIVSTEGEQGVLDNLKRKAVQADRMFENLVACMNDSLGIARSQYTAPKTEVPQWLTASK
jgi:hypothetical protein